MKVLGIESTAHTFSVGIVSGKKVLANERVLFTTEKLRNALKEADSTDAGSEPNCGSFNEA